MVNFLFHLLGLCAEAKLLLFSILHLNWLGIVKYMEFILFCSSQYELLDRRSVVRT